MNSPLASENGLVVKHLEYQVAGHQLFCNYSFTLQRGKLLQILGPNGVGKSTLLKILAGLIKVEQAWLSWDGLKINSESEDFVAKLFYLSDLIALKAELSVLENLCLDFHLCKKNLDEIKSGLRRFELLSYADCLVGTLSRGQKQRVALTKMLLSSADLFLLDEPLTGLDESAIEITRRIFVDKLLQGKAVILTGHYPLSLSGIDIQIHNLGEGG